MNNLYNKEGAFKADNLINDISVKLLTKAGKIKKGTTLERGTILANDKGGYVKKYNGASAEEKPVGILAEDIDAASNDEVGVVYISGVFNKNALTLDGELKEEAVEILREKGIFIKENMEVE